MTSFYWVYLLVALPSCLIVYLQGKHWHRSIWLVLLSGTALSIITATVKDNSQTHLICWSSIMLFLLFYRKKSLEYIQPMMMFSGTFFSMFITDLLTSLRYIPNFSFEGIGGAGIKDALVLVPYFVLVMSSVLYLVAEDKYRSTENI